MYVNKTLSRKSVMHQKIPLIFYTFVNTFNSNIVDLNVLDLNVLDLNVFNIFNIFKIPSIFAQPIILTYIIQSFM
jgi:hypothetical protein